MPAVGAAVHRSGGSRAAVSAAVQPGPEPDQEGVVSGKMKALARKEGNHTVAALEDFLGNAVDCYSHEQCANDDHLRIRYNHVATALPSHSAVNPATASRLTRPRRTLLGGWRDLRIAVLPSIRAVGQLRLMDETNAPCRRRCTGWCSLRLQGSTWSLCVVSSGHWGR